MEGSLHAENQFDLSSRFDVIPACDRQMDRQMDRQTHGDSKYLDTLDVLLYFLK